MLRISGGFLLLIGVLSGASLVVRPFGLFGSPVSAPAAWLLFPVGFATGSLLLALALDLGELAMLWRTCAALMLGLAVASALGLVVPILGIAEPVGSTLPLWYVLSLAGIVGTACALFPNPSGIRSRA